MTRAAGPAEGGNSGRAAGSAKGDGETPSETDNGLAPPSEPDQRFERLLLQLSTTFVSAPANQIDTQIETALRQVVDFLGLDGGMLSRVDPDTTERWITHSWAVPGLEPPPQVLAKAYPWGSKKILAGEIVAISRLEEFPEAATVDRETARRLGIQSQLSIPVLIDRTLIGMLTLVSTRCVYAWSGWLIERLQLLAQVLFNALARKQADLSLQHAFSEIQQLRERIQAENACLRQEIEVVRGYEEIVGDSEAIRRVLSQAEQVAPTNSSVLILGETGTGKELLARAIHRRSTRKDRLLVKVNCAALPATLVESELFGREKGAYTGALSKQVGRFEVADGSTIFLDEIGALPIDLQAKLLHVLQDSQFERLGSTRTIKVDVRVIAATNCDLAAAVSQGRFRGDLYYRLNVFPIVVPPLRDRRDDIPLLVWSFVKEFSASMGKSISTIPRRVMDALQACPWPGNVRELHNVIERAMILTTGPTLHVELPGSPSDPASRSDPARPPDPSADPTLIAGAGLTLEEIERRHILSVLERTKWRVRGKDGAAEILGLKPTTLGSRMHKLGIRRPASNC